jgi:tetratricopeptide (TPR) repeat protein
MSRLSVEKTIHKGGYEDASSTKDVRASKFDAGEDEDARLTPEERLLRAIEKDPANTANYIELNEMYQRDERFDKADELLTKALAASGGDVLIRERLEDVQLRRGTQTLMIAEKKAREEKTEESINLYRKLAADFNAKQIQIYAARCERYPTNIGFKYELATCYKKGKKFNDAIGLFQQCRSDLKRKGKVYLSLAECFYNVKQYKMALDHFEQAAKEIPEKDIEERKNAMYLAGKLAAGLKDYEAADKHFTALASLDFGYKDVSAWLDKLAKLREDGDDSAMTP